MRLNRLWVRMSFTFSAVVFISFVTIALVSIAIIRANAAELERLRAGSELTLKIQALDPQSVSVAIVDGKVVGTVNSAASPAVSSAGSTANNPTTPAGESVASAAGIQNQNLIPVVVDGNIVAYVDLDKLFAPPSRPLQLLTWEQLLAIIVAISILISVIFGVLMSRTLTKPLNNLAETADAVGTGQWDQRMPVTGTAEIKSLAQSFNKMIDRLQRNEQLRRNLVADVAHELRTPITALQANVYAILDDAYPMTKTEIAGLYDQTRMLSRLVKDLHELSQAESGLLPMDRQPIDFSQTLGELIAPFRSVAEDKDVKLVVTIPPSLPVVAADEERVNQVMHNLLSNALRYTPPEGTIMIRTRTDSDWLYIDVQDTGEGIAPEHLPNVFERFYRADFARSRQRGGMGLGLAISKAIVEAHDGRISVSSSGIAGEGTTFTVQLPILKAADVFYALPAKTVTA